MKSATMRRRLSQADFLARAITSLAAAKAEDAYVDPRTTFRKLESMLANARAEAAKKVPRP